MPESWWARIGKRLPWVSRRRYEFERRTYIEAIDAWRRLDQDRREDVATLEAARRDLERQHERTLTALAALEGHIADRHRTDTPSREVKAIVAEIQRMRAQG